MQFSLPPRWTDYMFMNPTTHRAIEQYNQSSLRAYRSLTNAIPNETPTGTLVDLVVLRILSYERKLARYFRLCDSIGL